MAGARTALEAVAGSRSLLPVRDALTWLRDAADPAAAQDREVRAAVQLLEGLLPASRQGRGPRGYVPETQAEHERAQMLRALPPMEVQ